MSSQTGKRCFLTHTVTENRNIFLKVDFSLDREKCTYGLCFMNSNKGTTEKVKNQTNLGLLILDQNGLNLEMETARTSPLFTSNWNVLVVAGSATFGTSQLLLPQAPPSKK